MRLRLIALAAALGLLAELVVLLSWSGTSVKARPVVSRIWLLGDSLTFGTMTPASAELTSPGGFRPQLDALLTQASIPHLFVGTSTADSSASLIADGQTAHDGHPGFRVDQVLADLDRPSANPDEDGGDWLTGRTGRRPLDPDIVVILLGTNDIEQRFDPQTRFPTATGLLDVTDPAQVATFVADLTARLSQLVDTIERIHPGTAIVLSDVPPLSRYLVDPIAGSYARAVATLVGQQRLMGRSIVFADAYKRFTERSALTIAAVQPGLIGPDGIHPSPRGYAVLSHVYAESIERLRGGTG